MKRTLLLSIAGLLLVASPVSADNCHYAIIYDYNSNCRVDIEDLSRFASEWLTDCNLDPTNPICIPQDIDKDGFNVSSDCNDDNPNIYPGALELCDTLDNDCDGAIDEVCFPETNCANDVDDDADGYVDCADTDCTATSAGYPSCWTCNAGYYADGVCDCGCGTIDSDCASSNAADCSYCNDIGSCSSESCPGTIAPNENWHCN